MGAARRQCWGELTYGAEAADRLRAEQRALQRQLAEAGAQQTACPGAAWRLHGAGRAALVSRHSTCSGLQRRPAQARMLHRLADCRGAHMRGLEPGCQGADGWAAAER